MVSIPKLIKILVSCLTLMSCAKVMLKFGIKPFHNIWKKKKKSSRCNLNGWPKQRSWCSGCVICNHSNPRVHVCHVISLWWLSAHHHDFLALIVFLNADCGISIEGHNKYVLNKCVFACVRARVCVWERNSLPSPFSQSATSTLTRAGAWPLGATVRVIQVVPWKGRHWE